MKRDKEKEKTWLAGDDISECQKCGNTNMWIGWDKDGYAISAICPKCLWRCGKSNLLEALYLKFVQPIIYKIEQAKEMSKFSKRRKTVSYRKVGYIEQCFYIISHKIPFSFFY